MILISWLQDYEKRSQSRKTVILEAPDRRLARTLINYHGPGCSSPRRWPVIIAEPFFCTGRSSSMALHRSLCFHSGAWWPTFGQTVGTPAARGGKKPVGIDVVLLKTELVRDPWRRHFLRSALPTSGMQAGRCEDWRHDVSLEQ